MTVLTTDSPAQPLAAQTPVGQPEIVGPHAGRTREVYEAYRAFRNAPGVSEICQFCIHGEHASKVLVRTRTMMVMVNEFPYALWDGLPVLDHLMIVPVRHLLSLDDFTDCEALDFFALLRRYEVAGYSVYSRSPGNTSRSVAHVHTHLIKTGSPA